MIFAPSKVLVVAPHTDDMELCCGGTVAKLVQMGAKVDCVPLSIASYSFFKDLSDQYEGLEIDAGALIVQESLVAAKVLGVTLLGVPSVYEVRCLDVRRQDILEDLLCYKTNNYDLVLGPSTRDTHQDHETVAKEIFRAFKDTTILAWEAPWNNLSSNLNMFVSLTEQQVVKKLKAVRCYDSQHTAAREYFTPDYLTSWARMRGGQVGYKYAEAFEIVRMKI